MQIFFACCLPKNVLALNSTGTLIPEIPEFKSLITEKKAVLIHPKIALSCAYPPEWNRWFNTRLVVGGKEYPIEAIVKYPSPNYYSINKTNLLSTLGIFCVSHLALKGTFTLSAAYMVGLAFVSGEFFALKAAVSIYRMYYVLRWIPVYYLAKNVFKICLGSQYDLSLIKLEEPVEGMKITEFGEIEENQKSFAGCYSVRKLKSGTHIVDHGEIKTEDNILSSLEKDPFKDDVNPKENWGNPLFLNGKLIGIQNSWGWLLQNSEKGWTSVVDPEIRKWIKKESEKLIKYDFL